MYSGGSVASSAKTARRLGEINRTIQLRCNLTAVAEATRRAQPKPIRLGHGRLFVRRAEPGRLQKESPVLR